jgi:hypothetical protein
VLNKSVLNNNTFAKIEVARTRLLSYCWVSYKHTQLLTEEAGRRRKRIGKDCFFQSGPGKAIDRLQPVLDGGDLGGEVVQLLAGALTGEGSSRGQHQAVQLVGVDQREPGVSRVRRSDHFWRGADSSGGDRRPPGC